MFEAGAFFQVADGELDDGVTAMELVDLDRSPSEVGEECVVSPVGPQLQLSGVGEAGAMHDQPADDRVFAFAGDVRALGDLGSSVWGVLDLDPGLLSDAGDRCGDGLVFVLTATV